MLTDIRITSVNSTNQASDVCRRTTSGSNNNNPHNNVNNDMTTPYYLLRIFDLAIFSRQNVLFAMQERKPCNALTTPNQ